MGNRIRLIASVAVPNLVGILSGAAVTHAPGDWYSALVKPSFTPPSWVFAPVWTVLYSLMGVSFFLVWRRGVDSPGVRRAMHFFALQLAFNALWAPLFFGLKAPGLALLDLSLLLGALLAALFSFFRIFKPAGVLLIPYLGWVVFAGLLNLRIWQLN